MQRGSQGFVVVMTIIVLVIIIIVVATVTNENINKYKCKNTTNNNNSNNNRILKLLRKEKLQGTIEVALKEDLMLLSQVLNHLNRYTEGSRKSKIVSG